MIMQRKMDLLERAHGLLCNAPDDVGDPQHGEWRKLRAEWIERYGHVISDHRTKHNNRRTAIGNDAIAEFEKRRPVEPKPLTWGGIEVEPDPADIR